MASKVVANFKNQAVVFQQPLLTQVLLPPVKSKMRLESRKDTLQAFSSDYKNKTKLCLRLIPQKPHRFPPNLNLMRSRRTIVIKAMPMN
jgi:uncharacterized protein (DUF2236 family)